jgi:hypothetical protein
MRGKDEQQLDVWMFGGDRICGQCTGIYCRPYATRVLAAALLGQRRASAALAIPLFILAGLIVGQKQSQPNTGFLTAYVASAKTHCSYDVRFSRMVRPFCTVSPQAQGSSNERPVLCWISDSRGAHRL